MKTAEFLQTLSDRQIQYVLVGGLAVQLHGFLRATFDIDLVLAKNDENLARFFAVAKGYGLVPAIPVPIEPLSPREIESSFALSVRSTDSACQQGIQPDGANPLGQRKLAVAWIDNPQLG